MALERLTTSLNAWMQHASTQGGSAATASPAGATAARNPAQSKVESFRALIDQAAQRHHVDAALLSAVVEVESAGNPKAVSPVGAQGLAQLMPGTAKDLGVQDALDPAQNLDGAAKYLRQLLGQFKGDVSKALAAYNAGPGNVQKYGGLPPFAETQAYVPAVLTAYNAYRQQAPAASSMATPQAHSNVTAASGTAGSVPASPLNVPWLLEMAQLRLQRTPESRETLPAV